MAIRAKIHCISSVRISAYPKPTDWEKSQVFIAFLKAAWLEPTNSVLGGHHSKKQKYIFGCILNSATPPFLVLMLSTFLHDIHNLIFN